MEGTEQTVRKRIGELAAWSVHLPREKCALGDKMPKGGQSCFQHRSDRQCHLAVERCQSDENAQLGVQSLETHIQTKNEDRGRLAVIQEEVILGNTGEMEEVEPATDGRNKCRNNLEGGVLGCLRRWRSSDESTSIHSWMEDYDTVKKQKCLEIES